MSSKGNNGSNGASQSGSGVAVNHHVDKSVLAPVSNRQSDQTQQGGASTAAPSSEAAEPDSDPPDPDSRPHSYSPPACVCDIGEGSDRSQAEEEIDLSPIRSALRSPGLRSNTSRHVTIVESESKSETTSVVSSSQTTEEGSSIRVTEQIKQGTFKDSHIIFKAGPPLAETLPKLERKEESGSGLEAGVAFGEGQPAAPASKPSTASPPITGTTTSSSNVAPLVKAGPTNEEKKKNREDRKKEKEKKKEEVMLFHHEREQEKKTKIVGTDTFNQETGEYGQWLKHAFLLGEGSYKNVYEGYNAKDGCKIAWCEYKQPFQPSTDTSDYSEKAITSESAIMKRLHHPHIVRCYDVLTSYYDIEEKRFSRYLVLIQERMEKDSLKTRIQRSFSEGRQHLSIRLIKRWMLQMLEAVTYLHKQKPMIIHRDLKPENIFMMSRESEDADDVKIGDFGLASYRDRTHKKTLAGTFGFMAPEMYGENYDEKVDIYALGMVWLEMFTNQPPFHELRGNFFLIASQTLKGKSPLSMNQVESMAFRELIMALIHPIPHWRPSAEMLQHHPLLQIKPIPIQALPHSGQEFVANMEKNHKLHVSVRLTDKKLRTAYGLDEGQCLDVDIDLYKEQAIEKTVEELQRDIESTLAERGGDATKVSVPKKWYDNVRMQLRLFRHLLLGQRWRYLYALNYPEKGEKNEKPGEPYFGPGGLPAVFFGGTGIVSVGPGGGGGGGGSDDAVNSHIVEDFYSNSEEDGPNCFISSAKQIQNMAQTNMVLERETGEKVMRHIKKAADPHAVLDSDPTANLTSDEKNVQEAPSSTAERDRHPNTPPRTSAPPVSTESAPPLTSQATQQSVQPTSNRPNQQATSQPVQTSSQPPQTATAAQNSSQPQGWSGQQTSQPSSTPAQPVQGRPSQQQASQAPQQPVQSTQSIPVTAVSQSQPSQPTTAQSTSKSQQTWSQPLQLQHPPQGWSQPMGHQHLPPGWSQPPVWSHVPAPEAWHTQPMWTQPPTWNFPTWSSPSQQTSSISNPSIVQSQASQAPFQTPVSVPMPLMPSETTTQPQPQPQSQPQPPTPHSGGLRFSPHSRRGQTAFVYDHVVDSSDGNISVPTSLNENGPSAQSSTGHVGFVPPGNLATIGGPVSSTSKLTWDTRRVSMPILPAWDRPPLPASTSYRATQTAGPQCPAVNSVRPATSGTLESLSGRCVGAESWPCSPRHSPPLQPHPKVDAVCLSHGGSSSSVATDCSQTGPTVETSTRTAIRTRSQGSKKKRVGGSGQSSSSKKRENCKVCLTHTDVDHGVTRMHIQVHLPDRPEKNQLMHKCTFALPINSSLKDIGKQVVDIIHDRFMKFGEHFYGPDMARCVQEEVTNIAGMFKMDPEMNLPFEVEFTGPEPQLGVQPPSSVPSAVSDLSNLAKQSSREDPGLSSVSEVAAASKPLGQSPNVTEEECATGSSSELTASHEAIQREITSSLSTLSLSDLTTVKELISGLKKFEPMVVVPEAGGGGRERRVLTVPLDCFFAAVPRKPSQPDEGYDVVKGGLGDKFVVSYPRETGMPRVWSSRSVREPVLIMPNERMYTIDRPAVLHQGPEGNIELLRLPGDDSDRLVYLRGGQAFNIEGPSVLLPGRGVFALPQPGSGTGVVVQVSDGGNYQALLQRPAIILPGPLPPGVDPNSPNPMRVFELPSNPNVEGLDFILSMLQILRGETASHHEASEGVIASDQIWTQDPVSVPNPSHSDQSNNQNMGTSSSERHSRSGQDRNHHPPKRKNSKEKIGGQARGAGDAVEGQGKSSQNQASQQPQSVTQVQSTQQTPKQQQQQQQFTQTQQIPSYPHMQTQKYHIQQPQPQQIQTYPMQPHPQQAQQSQSYQISQPQSSGQNYTIQTQPPQTQQMQNYPLQQTQQIQQSLPAQQHSQGYQKPQQQQQQQPQVHQPSQYQGQQTQPQPQAQSYPQIPSQQQTNTQIVQQISQSKPQQQLNYQQTQQIPQVIQQQSVPQSTSQSKPPTSEASNQPLQSQTVQQSPYLTQQFQQMQQQQFQQFYQQQQMLLFYQQMQQQQQQFGNTQQQNLMQQLIHQQAALMRPPLPGSDGKSSQLSRVLPPGTYSQSFLTHNFPQQQWPVLTQPYTVPDTVSNSPRKQPQTSSDSLSENCVPVTTLTSVPSSTSSSAPASSYAIATPATTVANGIVDCATASTCPPSSLANGVNEGQPVSETTIGRFSIVTVPSSVDD